MKNSGFVWSTAILLAGMLVVQLEPLSAQSGYTIKGKERAHCKLINVNAGRELYNGSCTIKEELTGEYAIFTIKMGSAQSFKFAGNLSNPNNWMHGAEKVKFRDRGHTGIFRWGNFRLEMDED